MKYFKSLLKDSDRTCTGVLCSHPLSRDIRVCIWVYLWIDDYSVVEFIGKIFIAVVSIIAALGFLLYGGRLFFMLRRFPIESKGRRKKLHEIANEIGVPILVDAPKNRFAGGPFLRIWVDIDVTKPLMRGKMIHIEGAEKGWVFFKYEKLPTCCYRKVWYTWPSRSGVSKGT